MNELNDLIGMLFYKHIDPYQFTNEWQKYCTYIDTADWVDMFLVHKAFVVDGIPFHVGDHFRFRMYPKMPALMKVT